MGRRWFTAAEGYTSRDLLLYARDHMASARVLFEKSWECFDSAGYLSHLGLELLLKAALLHRADAFPGTHDLPKLLRLVQTHDPQFVLDKADRDTLSTVSKFDIVRYPVPAAPVEIGDEDWPALERVWSRMARLLPSELRAHLTTKRIPTPDELKPFTDGKTVIIKGHRVLMRRRKARRPRSRDDGHRPSDR